MSLKLSPSPGLWNSECDNLNLEATAHRQCLVDSPSGLADGLPFAKRVETNVKGRDSALGPDLACLALHWAYPMDN